MSCETRSRWREAALDTPVLVLELPRGEVATVVADIATGAAGQRAIGKFRTGATPTWPWPDAAVPSTWANSAARADLPLKLTGGLHHLVRGTYADEVEAALAEQHHGVELPLGEARGDRFDGLLGRDLEDARRALRGRRDSRLSGFGGQRHFRSPGAAPA